MVMTSGSQQVRAALDHPVIDTDGHVQEFMPLVLPHLRESLGATLFEEFVNRPSPLALIMGEQGVGARLAARVPQSAWWATPAKNTRDLATAVLPRLLYERLDEFGIDFAVLFPSKALGMAGVAEPELRAGLCRGYNDYVAATYGEFSDRVCAAGVLPMHHPAEAVAEIEHCRSLGLKVLGLPEGVYRRIPTPGVADTPWLMPGQTHWFDTFGLDSAEDYDPVWAALQDAGIPVTFHGGVGNLAPSTFNSISSYTHNHIGFFAERMNRLCKSLFLGGVTNRFPELNIAFLECGVGWASSLLVDIVEHWEKRNVDALREQLDPDLIDWAELESLVRSYGPELVASANGGLEAALRAIPAVGDPPADADEFRHVAITSKQDIRDKFVPRFFFGCEADDRTVAFAFSKANMFEARLQPVFSSDISHWDVEEMNGVVDEAHGLVRKGLLTDEDFRDFVFRNPANLLAGTNPAFFAGTVVESAVAGVLRPSESV
jgi:predicted TIM-barrel fold metal-dependent hydrolase